MRHIFLIVLATIITPASYACSCPVPPLSEKVAHADQIFVGTVLKKTTSDQAYYLFSISQMFKGGLTDTVTISTPLSSCGMVFEMGESYLVYSNDKHTDKCHLNGLAANNPDICKLKYLFEEGFSAGIGQDSHPILTNNEAEYLNADLWAQRQGFDFHEKKVAFVLNGSLIDKQQYFKNWGGKGVVNNLVILSAEEREKANNYDAILVSWRKQGVSNGFRKKLLKRLS